MLARKAEVAENADAAEMLTWLQEFNELDFRNRTFRTTL